MGFQGPRGSRGKPKGSQRVKGVGLQGLRGSRGRLSGSQGFLVSGSFEKNGPWKTLIQDELIDTTGGRSADLLNFTMDKPVKIKFLKFELVSFWREGGGLQYFAPIAAT